MFVAVQREEDIQRRVRLDRLGLAKNATRLRDVAFECRTRQSMITKHYQSKLFNMPDRGLKLGDYLQTHLLEESEMDKIFHEIARHFPTDVTSPYMAEPFPLIHDYQEYEARQKRLFHELIEEQRKVVDLAKRATEKELGLDDDEEIEDGAARVAFDVMGDAQEEATPKEPVGVPKGTNPMHYDCFEHPKPCFKDMDAYTELLVSDIIIRLHEKYTSTLVYLVWFYVVVFLAARMSQAS